MLDDWRPATMPVRRPLVDQVIASLTRLVVDEDLHPGDRLPSEAQLATRLGVGRSTLREALRECREHATDGDFAAFVAADSRFHQVTAEATGNVVLVELYGVLRRS